MERIAKSLDTLRDQINARYPKRNKGSDGWIGDPAHRARKSDHNPDAKGVVRALDVTHDVDGQGDDFDSWKFAETLRLNRDPRVDYVISNGRIFYSGGKTPWQWQKYTGSNKHALHVHVSVVDDDRADGTAPWKLDAPTERMDPKPATPLPPGISLGTLERMGKLIVNYEARRDANKNIAVYTAGDGTKEIAGINERFHSKKFKELHALVLAGKHADVERISAQYVVQYTQIVAGWVTEPSVQFYLRDTMFNRGQDGAARVLQIALGMAVDGEVGPATRQRLADTSAADLLPKLRAAREKYEDQKYGSRPSLRKGLVDRWNRALADARTFQSGSPAKAATATTAVAAVAAPAAVAKKEKFVETSTLVAILILAVCVGLIVWKLWPAKRSLS